MIEQYFKHGWIINLQTPQYNFKVIIILVYLFKCSCSCRCNQIFLTHYMLHAWKTLRYVWFPVLLWTSFIIHDRSKASQIYHIFVHVIIEHLNWYLGQLNTLLPLTSGLWVACLLNFFSDRFSIQYKKLHLIYLGFIRDGYWILFVFFTPFWPL